MSTEILVSVAVVGAAIAFLQWRTAHQRVVLDLFDKRYAILSKLREPIGEIVREGKVANDVEFRFLKARDGAEFLFGKEVNEYLDRLYVAILDHHVAESTMEHPRSEEERRKAIDNRLEKFKIIADFFNEFPKLVAPYMRMRQKSPIV